MSEPDVAAMLGGARVLGERRITRLRLADRIRGGLPLRALDRVKGALGLTDPELAASLGTSTKTVGRMRRTPRVRLSAPVSDRLYRIARLFALAVAVFESEEDARQWLRAGQLGLGRRVPLELMSTEAGAREVEDLLGRIEHGVFS